METDVNNSSFTKARKSQNSSTVSSAKSNPKFVLHEHDSNTQMKNLKTKLPEDFQQCAEFRGSSMPDNSFNILSNLQDILEQNTILEAQLSDAKQTILAKNEEIEGHIETISFLSTRIEKLQEHTSNQDPNSMPVTIDKLRQRNNFLESQLNDYIEKVAFLENEKLKQETKSFSFVLNPVQSNENSSRKVELKQTINNSMMRIQEVEIEKLQLEENIDFINEKFHALQTNYNHIKSQLDVTIEKYESILNKVKEHEEEKLKYVNHAKKLEEQLKQANNNISNLYKKNSNLENNNKELTENLRIAEQEKRNYFEKWNRLSGKTKTEEKLKQQIKNLEHELHQRDKDIEHFREKYVNTNTELTVLREAEKTYKELLETNANSIKEIQSRFESIEKDRDVLLKQNMDLMEKLEIFQIESLVMNRKKDIQDRRDKEDANEVQYLQKSLNNMSVTVTRLQKEKADMKQRLDDKVKEIDLSLKRIYEMENAKDKLQAESNRYAKRYDLLKGDYEKLHEIYIKLLNEKQSENDLIENLQKKKLPSTMAPSECSGRDSTAISTPIEMPPNVVPYTLESDENYTKLTNLFKAIENEEAQKEIISTFTKMIENLKRQYQSPDHRMKYDRLLVKYYKSIERTKSIESTYLSSNVLRKLDESIDKSRSGQNTNNAFTKGSLLSSAQPLLNKIASSLNSSVELPFKKNFRIDYNSGENTILPDSSSTETEDDKQETTERQISSGGKEDNVKPQNGMTPVKNAATRQMSGTAPLQKSNEKKKIRLTLSKSMIHGRAKSTMRADCRTTSPMNAVNFPHMHMEMKKNDSCISLIPIEDQQNFNLDNMKRDMNVPLSDEDFKNFRVPKSYNEKLKVFENNLANEKDGLQGTLGNDRRARILDNSTNLLIKEYRLSDSGKKERRESALRGSSVKNKGYSDIYQNKKVFNNSNNFNIANILNMK